MLLPFFPEKNRGKGHGHGARLLALPTRAFFSEKQSGQRAWVARECVFGERAKFLRLFLIWQRNVCGA